MYHLYELLIICSQKNKNTTYYIELPIYKYIIIFYACRGVYNFSIFILYQIYYCNKIYTSEYHERYTSALFEGVVKQSIIL